MPSSWACVAFSGSWSPRMALRPYLGDIRLTPKQDREQVATATGRAGGATRDAGLLLMIALICGTMLTSASAEEWAVPDVDALPMDAFGRTVRLGSDQIVNTAATIGADASDPAKRFSGNGLKCQSCHLEAGTKKFGLPLACVWGLFPLFIARENEVRDCPPFMSFADRCTPLR
jgi:cytochrome c